MTTRFRRLAAIAAVLPALGGAALAETAAAAPTAKAAKSCSPPKYPGSGYFTSLSVSRTSCSTGARVAKAWYSCRTRKSVKGRCTKRVLRYRCTERRSTTSTEINAKVTCKRGRARVVHTYQQNLD